MCSIAAYTGKSQAYTMVERSLSKMTYRGYDSSGISVWDDWKGVIGTAKTLGTDLSGGTLKGTAGIGQTRWGPRAGGTH